MTSELALEEIQRVFSSTLGATSKSCPSLIKLAGDVSSRRYFRILNGNESWVLQVAEPFVSEKEHSFIQGQRLFSDIHVRVPKIIATAPEKGLILLEDLGDKLLQASPETALYEEAIDCIVQWTHLAHPHNPFFKGKNFPHFKLAFDFEKLNFEMNHSDVHLFQKLFGFEPGTFLKLSVDNTQYLSSRPRFLCHRDFHSKNIMISGEHIVVIDFQDARMGPITYDLVSLVWDPYAQLSQDFQNQLIKRWHEEVFDAKRAPFIETQLKETLQDFETEIERMKVQRLLKAAGSYASFFNTRGRRDYLNCIPYAIGESIKALRKLKHLSNLDQELLTFLSKIDFSVLEKL